MKHPYKQFLRFLFTTILIIGIYYAGYGVGHKNLVIENGYTPKILGINTDKPQDIDFSLFWNAWDTLKEKYVGELNNKNLVYGAISGMINASGDPYTIFMTPEEAKRFDEDLNGSFEGIGAELENKDGLIVVVAPLDSSPAQVAGLRAQDIVLKVDGQDVSKMSFYGTIDKIRGPKGSNVVLSVFRPSTKKNEEITITRDTITVKSVKWEEKNNNLYIRVSQFGDDTIELMKQAAQYAIDKNYQGIIIDLRDNPGGYLEGSIDMASLFLDSGQVVVKEQNKQGEKKSFNTTLSPILKNKKLVVLVDGGSASASEIFAGAIQDYKKGTLIGEKTFGKGSVQSLESMRDGSKIKVTIAKWLTPLDRAIDKQGITPDIEVKMSEDDIKNNRDLQLDKALEIIK